MTDDNSSIFDIMRDLQPIAFLISMCLVIAAFYVNNHVEAISLTNILVASLAFFIAYISLLIFRKTDFPLFRYFGEFSLICAAAFVFSAFTGIVKKIDEASNSIHYLYIFISLVSLFFITIMYGSRGIKKENVYIKCQLLFHLSLILFCLYIFLFVLGRFSNFQVNILSLFTIVVFILFWITQISCLGLTFIAYSYPNKLDSDWIPLFKKLKNEGTFSINPIESLKVIPSLLIKLCLLAIGFGFLLDGLGLLPGNPVMLIGIIAILIFFCLI